jgi:hypothetical protein
VASLGSCSDAVVVLISRSAYVEEPPQLLR